MDIKNSENKLFGGYQNLFSLGQINYISANHRNLELDDVFLNVYKNYYNIVDEIYFFDEFLDSDIDSKNIVNKTYKYNQINNVINNVRNENKKNILLIINNFHCCKYNISFDSIGKNTSVIIISQNIPKKIDNLTNLIFMTGTNSYNKKLYDHYLSRTGKSYSEIFKNMKPEEHYIYNILDNNIQKFNIVCSVIIKKIFDCLRNREVIECGQYDVEIKKILDDVNNEIDNLVSIRNRLKNIINKN